MMKTFLVAAANLVDEGRRDGVNFGHILNLANKRGRSAPAVRKRIERFRCSHDEGFLPLQPAPWLQHVFTRRAQAGTGSSSPSPRKRLVLVCRSTLSACLMRSSN